MGFYAAQWAFTQLPEGLVTSQICIMQRAGWSCFDDTAFLKPAGVRDVKWWLGSKCDLKPRSMERHLPQLARLDLLVCGDGGFRLPRFYQFHRQNGGPDRQIGRQFVRQNGAAYKEGIYLNREYPPYPLSGGKLLRRQRRRREALGPDRDELHEFTVARCEVCLVHHDWEVREAYVDSIVRVMACPDWRAKLRAAEAKS